MSTSPDVFTNRHATVTVTTEMFTANDGTVMPRRFRVASTSGYLASLSACGIQHGVEDERVPCSRPDGHSVNGKTSTDAWLEHSRHTCHGWHIESARCFAGEVLATYGAKRPEPKAPPKVRYRDAFVPLRKRELVPA